MKRIVRLGVGIAVAVSITLGALALSSAPARAVDNPCDPVYSMLKQCKAQHGHWDYTCCCCRLK